jgi:hypothetical protein
MTLIEQLEQAGQQHKGTDLGGLLQWAALHIKSQDEALAEARAELEQEKTDRIRMEQAIHTAKNQLRDTFDGLEASRPVQIPLATDHAPHINAMAFHGVEPYAKKKRK